MNMSKKNIICLALCAVALVGLLFLPWISIEIMGYKSEMNFGDIMDMMDAMGVEIDVVGDLGSILIIMGFAGGILGIIGCLTKKKGLITTGAIIGAAGILILVLAVNAYVQDMIGGYIDLGLTDWVGSGIWLSIGGYIAAAVVNGVMKDEA